MTEPSTAAPTGFWRTDRLAAVALLLLAGWVIWLCRGLPLGSLARPGPAAWPLALALLLGLLSILVLLGGGASPLLKTLRFGEKRHALALMLGGAFATVALEPLGYRLTMLAMLLVLIGVVERRPLLATLAVSGGLSFGTHFLFANLLKVPLPVGAFGL